MRAGEVIELGGLPAHYSKAERVALRSLIAGLDAAGCEPAAAWEQIMLVHRLKAQLGAVLVDEVEEASIRRGWDAAMAGFETALVA